MVTSVTSSSEPPHAVKLVNRKFVYCKLLTVNSTPDLDELCIQARLLAENNLLLERIHGCK